MRLLLALCLICTTTYPAFAQQNYPEASISNGQITLKSYLPDAEKAYYRGTRFDWSGVISSLQYQGHEYFGPWRDHDPKAHDAISGPVEAFSPIGFEEAQSGEAFLIIGVGMLQKTQAENYQFSKTYEILNSGKWQVKQKKNSIEYTQTLATKDGYAYQYTKRLKLDEKETVLHLEHSLKNTGKLALVTSVYNHNFFVIDGEPSGPNIVTKFPYPIEAEGRGFGELITVKDDRLVFTQQLQKGENVYCPDIQRFSEGTEAYQFSIENQKTGAGVKITADQPLEKLVYWASVNTACPEPYIQLNAQPGETFEWTITYSFYTQAVGK